MIPPDDPEPQTIVDSFISSLSGREEYYKKDMFWKIVDNILKNVLHSMDSWDDWHDYLAGHGIILVKRYKGEVEKQAWAKWARSKGLHIRKSPADSQLVDRTDEYLLIPEKTLERMIVLGVINKG